MTKWTNGTSGLVEAKHKLHVLILRMERLRLAAQLQRARGMLLALSPRVRR